MVEASPPETVLRRLLGFLNFSSSHPGPSLLADLNAVYASTVVAVDYETFVERRDAERIEQDERRSPESSQPGNVLRAAAVPPPEWQRVRAILTDGLDHLQATEAAFADTAQARRVIAIVFEALPSAYLSFHAETLRHITPIEFWQVFLVGEFLGTVLEVAKHDLASPVLPSSPRSARDAGMVPAEVGLEAEESLAVPFAALVGRTVERLNDYLGYRPVASLETQKTQPYSQEYVKAVPLYVRDAGVAVGPYRPVIEAALDLLRRTDANLLRLAQYDPDGLLEFAVDLRAYDFDHPVNKRPNYHFGLWDPARVGLNGRYQRFVIQEVTLDSLMARTLESPIGPPSERLTEAAAVLAGIILMASGISGYGPGAHDSTVQLPQLLPKIARYRDQFYEALLGSVPPEHRARLIEEAVRLRQPFAGARQNLNAELAGRRSSQLERVALARVFARLGYADAARAEIGRVATPSARIACEIDCRLDAADQAIGQGRLGDALGEVGTVLKVIRRGILSGAVIDPWNILGFDASFPLFDTTDAVAHDHRADELSAWIDQLFSLHARIWSEASARSDRGLTAAAESSFDTVRMWWRQFAAHEVSSLDAPNGDDAFYAAELVASALRLWHEGGAAAGNVAFWASHADMFDSARAYDLVIDALLEKGDFVASMALLIRWISEAESAGLSSGERSFGDVAVDWLHRLTATLLKELSATEAPHTSPAAEKTPHVSGTGQAPEDSSETLPPLPESATDLATRVAFTRVGTQARKFLAYLESNAGDLWQVPRFRPPTRSPGEAAGMSSDDLDPFEEDASIRQSANLDVTFTDSTDDGFQGSVYDPTAHRQDFNEAEIKRIDEHLAFLGTLATLWKMAAMIPAAAVGRGVFGTDTAERNQWRDTTQHWTMEAISRRAGLFELADFVDAWKLPKPSSDPDALIEYDRQRYNKESLQDRIIATCVEMADTGRLLLAVESGLRPLDEVTRPPSDEGILTDDERSAVDVLGAVLRGDVGIVRQRWQGLLAAIAGKSLLYVPLSKGGRPRSIVDARVWQRTVQDLLHWLPRLGMLRETCTLLDTARQMERDNPVGPGAVTEFDELFRLGCLSLVRATVHFSHQWPKPKSEAGSRMLAELIGSEMIDPAELEPGVTPLIVGLRKLLERLLTVWLEHSETLRLSVLEKVREHTPWARLIHFVKTYGEEIFSQRFFNLGNVRAILHQGVDAWLSALERNPPDDAPHKLLDALDREIGRPEAVESLTLVLEAIVENYTEYRDYNSTTTQSDRGELVYMLLDFLRLRMRYDRVAWRLRPVIWTHEILVREGCDDEANFWMESIKARVQDEAETYLARLKELQTKYAMRMPTIEDRLREKFLRPLTIDRLRALVRPAYEQRSAAERPAFTLLRGLTKEMVELRGGIGLDVPRWIVILDDEVEAVRRGEISSDEADLWAVPWSHLSLKDVLDQVRVPPPPPRQG